MATSAAVSGYDSVRRKGRIIMAIQNQVPLLYDENEKSNSFAWEKMIEQEQPDLIQVWGTEFTHGLCALRVAGEIPLNKFIAGYLQSIARHYLAGMTAYQLKKISYN